MPHRWCNVAQLRREQIESGVDLTFCQVFVPYYRALIGQLTPERLLEVGCGTGHLSLALAPFSQQIDALEPSLGMHDIAKEVLLGERNVTVFHAAVETFSPIASYDVITSHLCAQTVAELDEFFAACARVLRHGGLFLCAIPHPCFYNDYKRFISEDVYRYCEEHSTVVSFAITKDPSRPIEGVPYHHRPLGRYIDALGAAGLTLAALDEIWPESHLQQQYGAPWREPRYCVLRARRQ